MISTEQAFTKTDLSSGEHIIYFKVKDNLGRWSSEASQFLTTGLLCGDVSGDEEISAYDAALIAQRSIGLINKFPVE